MVSDRSVPVGLGGGDPHGAAGLLNGGDPAGLGVAGGQDVALHRVAERVSTSHATSRGDRNNDGESFREHMVSWKTYHGSHNTKPGARPTRRTPPIREGATPMKMHLKRAAATGAAVAAIGFGTASLAGPASAATTHTAVTHSATAHSQRGWSCDSNCGYGGGGSGYGSASGYGYGSGYGSASGYGGGYGGLRPWYRDCDDYGYGWHHHHGWGYGW